MAPRQEAEPAELARIYDRRFDSTAAYRAKVWRTLIDSFFGRLVGADAAVLDLGCGYGDFINHVSCGAKYAIDLNPHARARLTDGVDFFQQDCSARWPLPSSSLDLVFTSNFLEHLPSKTALSSTLAEAGRCLRTGGRFIALGPNIKYTGGAYWDFFDHHLPLTELSLVEALEIQGFRAVQVIDRFLPYTMAGARQYPMAVIALYLKMPFVWRFFGKQFLVVAQRASCHGRQV